MLQPTSINLDPQALALQAKTPLDAKKWKAAQDFETMFVQQMFAAMRKTVPDSGLTEESNGRRIFTEMLDGEMSKLASRQGLGLAKLIYKQLEGSTDIPLQLPKSVKSASTNNYAQYKAMPQKASAPQVDSWIQEASHMYGLDASLLKSVVQQESAGNSLAKSPKGAMGLMQLMPATAQELGVKDPWDGRQNVLGGARYLKQMLKKYDGDEIKALAAYNAGPGNVDKYGGVPPFAETQNYVKTILDRKARNMEVADAR